MNMNMFKALKSRSICVILAVVVMLLSYCYVKPTLVVICVKSGVLSARFGGHTE